MIGLGLVVFAGVVAIVAIYLQRQALGARALEAYLRRQSVPAAIHIDRLGLDGASGAMRLGPPARPDLIAPRVTIRFAGPRPGALAPPQIAAVELFQPMLRAKWRDGRLDFGSLQGLIERSQRGGGGGAAPDVTVHDGRLQLETPAGAIVLDLDGALSRGRLTWLQARLPAVDLHAGGTNLAVAHGALAVRAEGPDRLAVDGVVTAARVFAAGATLSAPVLSLNASIPNPTATGAAPNSRKLTAILRLQTLQAASAKALASSATKVDATLTIDGQLDRALSYRGQANAEVHVATLATGRLALTGLHLTLGAPRLQLGRAGASLAGGGPVAVTATAIRGRAASTYGPIQLADLRLDARGDIRRDDKVHLQATGAASGKAALDAVVGPALRPLAHGAPTIAKAVTDAFASASLALPSMSLTVEGDDAWSIRLNRAATLALATGQVTARPLGLAPMAGFDPKRGLDAAVRLSARLRGLPQLDATVTEARLTRDGALSSAFDVRARGDVETVRGGVVQARGQVSGQGPSWTLRLTDCATAGADSIGPKDNPVATRLSGEVCPAVGSPLLALTAGGWRAAARLQGVNGEAPRPLVHLHGAQAALSAYGRGAALHGTADLADATLVDAAKPPRFGPLVLRGSASLADRSASGRIDLAGRRAQLGTLDFRADLQSGQGRVAFDSGRLLFDPKGLRPADISPALAAVLPQAKGAVDLKARADWTRAGLGPSSGELRLDDFGWKTGVGQLSGVRADVVLSSLSPFQSDARQTITAERLDALVPLTNLAATFSLAPHVLRLDAASADVAAGRATLDPMILPLGASPAGAQGTLRLQGVDLQRVLGVFNLSNAVTIQARVSGVVPFAWVAGPGGAMAPRIDHGRLYADGPGRLTIQRKALGGAVATAGAAGAQPTAVQDFAYQALEDLAFSKLEAQLASRPGGRLGAVLHVVGRHDPKQDRPTRIGLWALLRGHGFDKPLPLPKGTPIDLTLDTSLNLDDLLAQYGAINARTGSAAVQP